MAESRLLKVGNEYRYADKRQARTDLTSGTLEPTVGGFENFYYITAPEDPEDRLVLLERGISVPAAIRGPDGIKRRPVILINNRHHKEGSDLVPWHDRFISGQGFRSYMGDAKRDSHGPPEAVQGNAQLLTELSSHMSRRAAQRELATPILLFSGTRKGYISFLGLSVITSARRVVSEDVDGAEFENYAFDLDLLDLTADNDSVDWKWINQRRSSRLSIKETLSDAPEAWRLWIEMGISQR